jgi:hypothetical protein
MSKIEDFFADFANSECDSSALDGDVLCEMFQGVMSGHAVELIEMNDGEYYVLAIYAHGVQAWNCSEAGRFAAIQGNNLGESLYRFETIGGARDALSRFMAAKIADTANN